MATVTAAGVEKKIVKTLALGVLTLVLYAGLFLMEDLVLGLSTLGGWFGLIPVGIAFIFSLAHGAFTGYFWDLLGVRAKK
ncbi:MAG: hypothetical protein EPO27_04180 [Betaproteobacteria bacterium]|nr:MAG: hypothetical protein EPO27_04180 [Betaproteobacteria bacterium]